MSSLDMLLAAQDLQAMKVEMVKMCIAEAGYDAGSIRPLTTDDASFHEGFTFICVGDVVPADVCWRARELVGIGEPKCFRCTNRDGRIWGVVRPCRATARLVLDCGAQGLDCGAQGLDDATTAPSRHVTDGDVR